MGAATVSATVLAFAPGYMAETWTTGGTTSGYWAIGSPNSATTPTMTITTDNTVAKIGRSMKKLENIEWTLGLGSYPPEGGGTSSIGSTG